MKGVSRVGGMKGQSGCHLSLGQGDSITVEEGAAPEVMRERDGKGY